MFVFFSVCIGFSQPAKTLNGRVECEKIFLKKIEIVNETKKTIVLSDSQGNFSINVSENDVLFFLSKKHTDKKIIINKTFWDNYNFVVDMQIKPVELDEVEVVKIEKVSFKVTQGDIDAVKIANNAARPKNNVYTGEIENGIDFVRIGKEIFKIFKRKKTKTTDAASKMESIDFKSYMKSNYNTLFFVKTLDLKVEEINWFLEYCNADSNAKKVIQSSNVLDVMGFLLAKRKEFKQE